MTRGARIETYLDESTGRWRNRIVGSLDLPGDFDTEEDAVHLGRHEAIRRGVRHVVRRPEDVRRGPEQRGNGWRFLTGRAS